MLCVASQPSRSASRPFSRVEPGGDGLEEPLELADERRAEEDEEDDHHGDEGQVDERNRQPAGALDAPHGQDHRVEEQRRRWPR